MLKDNAKEYLGEDPSKSDRYLTIYAPCEWDLPTSNCLPKI